MRHKDAETVRRNKANHIYQQLDKPAVETLADIAFLAGQLYAEGKICVEDSRTMNQELKQMAVDFELGFDAADEKRDYQLEMEAHAGNKLHELYGPEQFQPSEASAVIDGYHVIVGGTWYKIVKEDGSGTAYYGDCLPGTTPQQVYNQYHPEHATEEGGVQPPSSLTPKNFRDFIAALYISYYAGREQYTLDAGPHVDFVKAVTRCAEEYVRLGSRTNTWAFRQGALNYARDHLSKKLRLIQTEDVAV